MISKKILVVDDEPEVCELIADVMKSEGFDVDCVFSGRECIDKMKKDGYSVVLLDIMMPDLSGEDVLKLLRQEFNKKIHVVYVTVVPKDEVDIKHVDGFVQKPFRNEDLVKVVKGLV